MGLEVDSTEPEIKRRFKALSLKYHPGNNSNYLIHLTLSVFVF